MLTCHLFAIEYHADPRHYFSQLHAEDGAVLLDSGKPNSQRGRYDLLSAWPLATITPHKNESHSCNNCQHAKPRMTLNCLLPAA